MDTSLDHTGLTTLPVSDELGRVRARRAHDVLDGHLNATSRNVGMGAAETYTWEGLGRKMADVADSHLDRCVGEDDTVCHSDWRRACQK